jgi:hypothetical protein
MADGSVKALSNSTNPTICQQIGDREDGEMMGDWY